MTENRLKIATLRGPSAVEMVRMIEDSKKNGNPEVCIFDEPLEMLAGMSEGSVDFAVLPVAMTGKLKEMGIDYRVSAIMIWGGLYVCGTDSGIHSLEDLKGKTINVMAQASAPEMMLRHLLEKVGVDTEKELRFDRTFPTHKALADAAAEGKTGLCILSEPYISLIQRKNPGMDILLDICGEWEKIEGSLPAVTAFLYKAPLEGKGAVDEMTDALRRSCEWVKENPEEAAVLTVRLGIFNDAGAICRSIPRSGFDVVQRRG